MVPPLIMPFSVLERIDHYQDTLRSNMPTTDADFHPQSPPNDESGNEQGSSNLRQGWLGDAEGLTAAAVEHLLVLEGVDEDAEGADATMRDELAMMARDDPMWMREFRKYLQEEEKEREEVQKERAVRLALARRHIVTNLSS